MEEIDILLNEVREIAAVEFKVSIQKKDIYTSQNFKCENKTVSKEVEIDKNKFTVTVSDEDQSVLSLLSHYVKKSILNKYKNEEKLLIEFLEDRCKFNQQLLFSYPFLKDKFSIITIFIENNITESIYILKEGYKEQEIAIIQDDDNIIIIGKLEDPFSHALSIKETLSSSFAGRCIISYCNVNKYSNAPENLKKCKKKIITALMFNIQLDILGENDLIFEEIIENINENKKNDLLSKYNKGFVKLDSEMINTIEVFFGCGLNTSESAKKLFIHRNTLIYRLDKIMKFTGFDIRDFASAVVFKIIFLIWKEKDITKNKKKS